MFIRICKNPVRCETDRVCRSKIIAGAGRYHRPAPLIMYGYYIMPSDASCSAEPQLLQTAS